jgi:predicted CoA-binding protein
MSPLSPRPVGELIADFLRQGPWAVVGASSNREKYGNKVLRAYQQKKMEVFPINPKEPEVEGLKAYPDLAALPKQVRGISVITPPPVTEKVVAEAADAGVKIVWLQPGAESERAIQIAHERGLEIIADGSCLLVVTGYHE